MYQTCDCCEEKVAVEKPDSMFCIMQDNYELAMKIRELAQHINGQLYAVPYEDEKVSPSNCALDTLVETRRLLRSASATINDIRMRMEG